MIHLFGGAHILKNFLSRFIKPHSFKTFILISFGCALANGQIPNYHSYSETGQPFVTYFGPKVYNASALNWTIVQDKRGVIYFGNGSGILEYDGTSWRKIPTPNSANVRSLAVADDGTIYVCASKDFGYLKPDTAGQLQYQSLKPYLDKKYRNHGEIWDVSTSSEGIFFKTKDKIFKWAGGRITVFDSVIAYRLYKIDDKIYSRNNTIGLMVVDGDSLKLMPDGGFFSSTGVFNMLPYRRKTANGKDKILVATNYKGLFLHDGKRFSPFKTEVDSFLIHNQIYNSCITADGNYAFATQRGGLVIIDPKGRLVQFIDEDSGLPTNVVYDVYADRQGGLWLATLYGIVYCEAPSPFSVFRNRGSLNSMSNSVIRFKGTVYAANELGVLYFSEKEAKFKLVEGSNKPAFKLYSAQNVLFACTNWGLATINGKKLDKFLIKHSTNTIVASKIFPGRIYVGHRDGWTVLQKQKNGRFGVVYTKDTEDEIFTMVEENDGSLWLAGYLSGIFHVSGRMEELSAGSDKNIRQAFYEKENGLPGNVWNVYLVRGKMLLTTDTGIFSFDQATEKFLPDSTLGAELSDPRVHISLIEKGIKDNLWILVEKNGTYALGKALLQKDDTYKWAPIPEFGRLELGTVITIYSDYDKASKTEILWIPTNEALIRYNPDISKNFKAPYRTLIRRVHVQNDSLIYGGSSTTQQKLNKTILPFTQNDISFEFSAITFDKHEATRYQYYLEGNDGEWSKWTAESGKEYTNLSGGDYTFRVRSKNVYDRTGKEDIFHFTVLPPWYFTWWAYLFYALLIAFGFFTVDRFQRRRVINKERERARLREAELIRKQAEELDTVDKLVRGINKADDLETLFNSLLEKTISFIPQAEKAALFLFNHKENQFRIAYSSGYNIDDLDDITFLPQELKNRYTKNSDEIEKGIYIINNTDNLAGDEKLSKFKKAKSMLVMAVEWEKSLEAFVVFDNFKDKNAFGPSSARILNKFREHAVSAISKARSLKVLQEKNEKIIRTQEQLVMQEKLASLGQLTAGIAHEIKNPLNFVKNFAEISVELMQELREYLEKQKDKMNAAHWKDIEDIMKTLEDNSRRITEHGSRADSIVRSMLQHSRGKSGERRETDINSMLEENINLVYHGMRAQDNSFNLAIHKDFDSAVGKWEIVPQDISRVFLNVLQNAFYAAMHNRNEENKEPTVWVKTKNLGNEIEISIRDNGPGIPQEIRDKIFHPFFSTKPSGEGTGLGLSIVHDIIVKEHGGEISFETRDGKFTEFIIKLPDKNGHK